MRLQSFITVFISIGFTCLLFCSAGDTVKCGSLLDPPCYCEYLDDNRYNFKCFNVESQTIADYLTTPNTTSDQSDADIELEEFAIIPFLESMNELEEIGEDILGGRKARVIRIATPDPYDYSIRINTQAFNSSRSFIRELIIYDAALSQLDWDFVQDFTSLTTIHLQGIVNGIDNFASSLPTLDSVTHLTIASCSEISLPSIAKLPSIRSISLIENELTDSKVTEVLNPLNGADGLEYVSLRKNKLTIYPSKLTSFPTLNSVDLSENDIAILDENNPIKFTVPVKYVDLSKNVIRSILNNKLVFDGDFSQALIKLDTNKLTTIEGNVFFDLTQAMIAASDGGQISFLSNEINCMDCSALAWLVRDNKYLIDNQTVIGDCNFSNDTMSAVFPFTQLNPDDYEDCPPTSFTTTTTTTTMTTTTFTQTTSTPTTTTTNPITTESTTTATNPTTTTLPPDDTYQEQLAALFGLFGGLFLIVLIGFVIIIKKMNKAKNLAVGVKKPTETFIESAPKTLASNQELIGGYGTQPQQMTSFTQPQRQSVLPRVSVPPPQATVTNGNASNTNGQQPRGLRRTEYY